MNAYTEIHRSIYGEYPMGTLTLDCVEYCGVYGGKVSWCRLPLGERVYGNIPSVEIGDIWGIRLYMGKCS